MEVVVFSKVHLGSGVAKYVVGSSVASLPLLVCSSSGLSVSVSPGFVTGSPVGVDHVSEVSETEVHPAEPSSPVPLTVAVFSTQPESTSP